MSAIVQHSTPERPMAVDPRTGQMKPVRRIEFTDGSSWSMPRPDDATRLYRNAVMRALRNDKPRSFNAICARAGGDMLSTIAALKSLEDQGRAVKVSRECWQALPAKGVA